MTDPDFSSIYPPFLESAWESWNQGDVEGILCLVGHNERGRLLMDNIQAFKAKGVYETALASTYTHGPHFAPMQWVYLFALADREKLLACGDSIPAGPITVYRGVSCSSRRKWIRNFSWTTNPNTAAWFATRYSTPESFPAVYSVVARVQDVLFMTNERAEQEAVVDAWACGRMRRLKTLPESVKPG